MGLRGALSGVARTAEVPLTGGALIQIFLMTSTDQRTSTLTSALATGYVNLKDEEDLCRRKRSGGEGALDLPFLLTTGSSVRETAGVLPGALLGHGKAADLETSDFPGILKTRDSEGAERKASEEEPLQGMRAVLPLEEGMAFLDLRTLAQRRVLILLMKQPEVEISEVEVAAPQEVEGRAYCPLLMSSHALREGGSQTPGTETASQGQVMNISEMLLAPIIPLTMVIPQPAESALLPSRAWTWHLCHLESAPGMTGQALLSTGRWRHLGALRKSEEAKAEGAQDHPRECQNLGVPAPWMENTMMDITEMNLLGALQAVAPLLEGAGVAVTGVEEVT